MPRFVVVLPLDPLPPGQGFATSDWPPHVTLVPPFAIDTEAREVAQTISAALTPPQPLDIVAADDDWFGPRRRTLVTLLEPSTQLRDYHYNAVGALRTLGARFPMPEHLEAGYQSHVTVQRRGRLNRGDRRRLEQVALIDMQPESETHPRVVREVIPLHAR